MSVTQELVDRIAQLSRRSLSQEEKLRMQEQLETVLSRVADPERLRLEESVEELCQADGEEKTGICG